MSTDPAETEAMIRAARRPPLPLRVLDKIPCRWWRELVATIRWRYWPVPLTVSVALYLRAFEGQLVPHDFHARYRRRELELQRRRSAAERWAKTVVPWLALVSGIVLALLARR
jgi:uncharacterized membrane protein YbhN (UPF0104 family)